MDGNIIKIKFLNNIISKTAVDLLNSGFAYPIYKSFLLLLPLAIRAKVM